MLTSVVVLLATLATASADVWPMPRSVAISTPSVNVNATITASTTPSNRLSQIMARYASSFLLDTGVEADLDVGFDEIRLDVLSTDESLTQATDVSYNITAASSSSSSVVVISSATIYGAQYGLETLKQMLSRGPTLPQSIDVIDSPTYNHRGFMVDTGRRFVPLQVILDNLDAMAMTKLNVLHLHFADWCRFAIESENFPQLTAALTDEQGGFYTKDEIKQMIEYANDRGIRVVPELDLPGHSHWGLPLMDSGELEYCTGSKPYSILDDSGGHTEKTLKLLISEMIELFGAEELFHIGADETTTLDDEGCTIDNIAGIESKIFQHILDEGKTPVGWEEVFYGSGGAEGFEGEAVINAWNEGPRPSNIIADGFDALESYSPAFYLNNKPTWTQVYKDIAQESSLATTDAALQFRGGEVSMWTDNYCYSLQCGAYEGATPVGAPLYPPSQDEAFSASFQGMVWPKAAIAAGSFWNYQELSEDDLTERISEFAERLLASKLDACPNDCDCDELSRCGKPYPILE